MCQIELWTMVQPSRRKSIKVLSLGLLITLTGCISENPPKNKSQSDSSKTENKSDTLKSSNESLNNTENKSNDNPDQEPDTNES